MGIISIHAPRGGSDNPDTVWGNPYREFQSTLPVGGATTIGVVAPATAGFQSTLPVGGATDGMSECPLCYIISIHAPRGGSDWCCCPCTTPTQDFNPRSPWGERLPHRCTGGEHKQFQSTLPVGGATPTGEDPDKISTISIHAPRGGSDVLSGWPDCQGNRFQSTLPVGGATAKAPKSFFLF